MSGEEFVNFVNEDREFFCNGNNVKWFLPNGSRIIDDNVKYDIVLMNEHGSKLLIKNVNAYDTGTYRCVLDKIEKKFELKTYCK